MLTLLGWTKQLTLFGWTKQLSELGLAKQVSESLTQGKFKSCYSNCSSYSYLGLTKQLSELGQDKQLSELGQNNMLLKLGYKNQAEQTKNCFRCVGSTNQLSKWLFVYFFKQPGISCLFTLLSSQLFVYILLNGPPSFEHSDVCFIYYHSVICLYF